MNSPVSVMTSLEIESTLTDRYQTNVPDAERRTLKLRKREQSLTFIARDMEVRPVHRYEPWTRDIISVLASHSNAQHARLLCLTPRPLA
jgi:bifunctional DNA-binding transcriptional regulator/antitoxin component of YhaV-PrlF toxin-antitoxin module